MFLKKIYVLYKYVGGLGFHLYFKNFIYRIKTLTMLCRGGTIWYCAGLLILFPYGYLSSNGRKVNAFGIESLSRGVLFYEVIIVEALVVYYSRTGTTKKVAEEISKALKCDIESICDNKTRSGVKGYIICGFEGARRKIVKINAPKKKASDYDVVIIGTPIWGWNMSSLIRGYLTNYGKDCKNVAFFCTQGGSGAEKAFKEMGEICGKRAVAVMALTTKEVNEGSHTDKVKVFAGKIK